MRTLLGITAAMTILLVAASAPAQQIATIGKEVPDVKVKSSQDGSSDEEFYLFDALRGGIAVFYFWRSTSLDSLERLSQMEELHRQWGDKGVRFVSITADKQDKVEEILKEKNFDFFRFNFRELTVAYYHLGALSDPYVVLVDPRGILAWRGRPSDRLEERLADLHARTDPPVGNETWLSRRFRRAERFYDQHKYGRANTIAMRLFKMTDESHTMHGRAESLMAKCEEAADEWLKEAIRLEGEKKYEEAARIVAEIAIRFEDPDEGKDQRSGDRGDDEHIKRKAEREIGRMNGNRKLKKLIREARENAEGQLLNDRAGGLEEDGYYIDAKHIYEEVVKEHEDTDAAKEAKRRIRRIERDQGIRKKIAERRARDQAVRWLDLGDRFAAIELYDEARAHYERLIEEHPDTTAAQRGQERLSELPEPTAKESAESDAEGTEGSSKP